MGLAYGYWGEAAMMAGVYGASAMSMLYPGGVDSRSARDYKDAEVAVGNNARNEASLGYKAPTGGGGSTATFNINGKTITFGHGGQHLECTGLSVADVNQAIANHVSQIDVPVNIMTPYSVTVNGISIEYRAYGFSDGRVNIGTYSVHAHGLYADKLIAVTGGIIATITEIYSVPPPENVIIAFFMVAGVAVVGIAAVVNVVSLYGQARNYYILF
ncbi:MAG: hypothetical protein LBK41_09450 [Clostridiales bacterium]|jgi:hypothetical protein|nr:hypothetical protein [Clostridiales bacterium]